MQAYFGADDQPPGHVVRIPMHPEGSLCFGIVSRELVAWVETSLPNVNPLETRTTRALEEWLRGDGQSDLWLTPGVIRLRRRGDRIGVYYCNRGVGRVTREQLEDAVTRLALRLL